MIISSKRTKRSAAVAATLDNCNRLANLIVTLGGDNASASNIVKARELISAELNGISDSSSKPKLWVRMEGAPEVPGVYMVRNVGAEFSEPLVVLAGRMCRYENNQTGPAPVGENEWRLLEATPEL